MATDRQQKPDVPQNQDPLASLDRFLTKFAALTSQASKSLLSQSTDADDKEILEAYAKPLNEQVTQLSDHIRQIAKNSSRQVLEEIGIVLRLSAADALTDSGMRVAQNLSSQKAKIALTDIVDLIKKIIRKIFDIFHIPKPDWLEPLLDLIDEIFHFLVSIGLLRLAHTLSKRHQDYMAELTQMKRLQRASRVGSQNEDEDGEDEE